MPKLHELHLEKTIDDVLKDVDIPEPITPNYNSTWWLYLLVGVIATSVAIVLVRMQCFRTLYFGGETNAIRLRRNPIYTPSRQTLERRTYRRASDPTPSLVGFAGTPLLGVRNRPLPSPHTTSSDENQSGGSQESHGTPLPVYSNDPPSTGAVAPDNSPMSSSGASGHQYEEVTYTEIERLNVTPEEEHDDQQTVDGDQETTQV